MQHAAKEICTKMANPTRGSWNRLSKAWQICEESGEGDVGEAGVETRRYERGCARGSGLGTRAQKEVDERRHDDGQGDSGETLVENAGFTCAEHGAVVTRAAERLGMQSLMTDLGLYGQTATQPKRMLREEDLQRPDTLMCNTCRGDHIRKSQNEAGTRRATFGGPLDEGNVTVRN